MVRERVEAAFLATRRRCSRSNPELVAEIEAAFAPPAFEAAAPLPPLLGAGPARLGRHQRRGAQARPLRDRHGVAEADRRHAGRRHGRADAAGGGSRRGLLP